MAYGGLRGLYPLDIWVVSLKLKFQKTTHEFCE